MEDLEKNIYVNRLFDLYGNLLSPVQQKMIIYYYKMDLSLSEISSLEDISRNGVYDAIKKGKEYLYSYEEKLGILKKETEFLQKLKDKLSKEDYEKVVSLMMEE